MVPTSHKSHNRQQEGFVLPLRPGRNLFSGTVVSCLSLCRTWSAPGRHQLSNNHNSKIWRVASLSAEKLFLWSILCIFSFFCWRTFVIVFARELAVLSCILHWILFHYTRAWTLLSRSRFYFFHLLIWNADWEAIVGCKSTMWLFYGNTWDPAIFYEPFTLRDDVLKIIYFLQFGQLQCTQDDHYYTNT